MDGVPREQTTKIFNSQFPLEFLLLVVVVLASFAIRLPDRALHGEETRRGQAAKEMLETGDWVLPRQQRQAYLIKPPMISWVLATTGHLRGQIDEWTIRLPSLISTLLTVLLIYVYCRHGLSRFGAFTAAFAYATMGGVLHSGVDGEVEPLFILLVAASLMIWHIGYLRSWSPLMTWSLGYAICGLAMLTKGMQAPVYFCGGIGMFLIVNRDWKFLFHRSHLVGGAIFAAMVAAYVIPLSQITGWAGPHEVFLGQETTHRLTKNLHRILINFATYPVEHILLMMPWSLNLVAFCFPAVRKNLAGLKPMLLFSLICFAVAFPTCWLAPGTETRYFRPLYPCIAVMIGIAVQRIAEQRVSERLFLTWQKVMYAFFATISLLAIVAIVARFVKLPFGIETPSTATTAIFVSGVVLAIVWLLFTARSRSGWHEFAVVLCTGLLASLAYNTVIVEQKIAKSLNPQENVARVADIVPAGELMSFGRLHHRFTFFYPEPIPVHETPIISSDLPKDIEYFSFFVRHPTVDDSGGIVTNFPFEWELVEVLSMDRNRPRKQKETAGKLDGIESAVLIGKVISHEQKTQVAERPTNAAR